MKKILFLSFLPILLISCSKAVVPSGVSDEDDLNFVENDQTTYATLITDTSTTLEETTTTLSPTTTTTLPSSSMSFECESFASAYAKSVFRVALGRSPNANEMMTFGAKNYNPMTLIENLLGPYGSNSIYRSEYNRKIVDDVYLLLLKRKAESTNVKDQYYNQYEDYGYFTANSSDYSKAGIIYAISASAEFVTMQCLGSNDSYCNSVRGALRFPFYTRHLLINQVWMQAFGSPVLSTGDSLYQQLVSTFIANPRDEMRQVTKVLLNSQRFKDYINSNLHKPTNCVP